MLPGDTTAGLVSVLVIRTAAGKTTGTAAALAVHDGLPSTHISGAVGVAVALFTMELYWRLFGSMVAVTVNTAAPVGVRCHGFTSWLYGSNPGKLTFSGSCPEVSPPHSLAQVHVPLLTPGGNGSVTAMAPDTGMLVDELVTVIE